MKKNLRPVVAVAAMIFAAASPAHAGWWTIVPNTAVNNSQEADHTSSISVAGNTSATVYGPSPAATSSVQMQFHQDDPGDAPAPFYARHRYVCTASFTESQAGTGSGTSTCTCQQGETYTQSIDVNGTKVGASVQQSATLTEPFLHNPGTSWTPTPTITLNATSYTYAQVATTGSASIQGRQDTDTQEIAPPIP